MKMSEKINELAAALAKVQGVLRGAEKNAENPHFRSDFANLESIWESIRAPLAENNLSVVQTMGMTPDYQPTLVTTLLHSSGQWIAGEQLLKPTKADPQGIGAASTYARRYGLAAIVGQIQSDDDGETAQGRGKEAGKGNPRTPTPEPQGGPGPKPSTASSAPTPKPETEKSISSAKKEPDSWTIPFGKFKGKNIHAVPVKDLREYANYLITDAKANKKPLDRGAKELVDRVRQLAQVQ